MQVTVSSLQQWFAAYNQQYFDNELPIPMIEVGKSRTRLGTMSWKKKRTLFGMGQEDYVIRLSNYYDLPENNYQDTLLHEMIHLYIVFKKIKDTSSHGRIFRMWMARLNSMGRHITVSANMKNMPASVARPRKGRVYIVLAVCTTSKKYMLSVVNKAYVHRIHRVLKASADVEWHAWYASADSYFDNYPVVRTPKARYVDVELFKKMTALMQPIKL